MAWTPDKIADLRERAEAGMSVSQVAAAMGVSYGAVLGAAWRRGISFRDLAKKTREVGLDAEIRRRWMRKLPSMRERLRAEVAKIMAD